MEIYNRLKKLCELKGTSITALCLYATGNKGNLQTWKNNGGHMRSDYLLKCAEFLGCSTDYILGKTDFSETENRQICSNLIPYLSDLNRGFKTINGVTYEVPYKIFDDIKSKEYKFTKFSLRYFSLLCGIAPTDLLPESKSSNIIPLSHEQSGDIAAYGEMKSEGKYTLPEEEISE